MWASGSRRACVLWSVMISIPVCRRPWYACRHWCCWAVQGGKQVWMIRYSPKGTQYDPSVGLLFSFERPSLSDSLPFPCRLWWRLPRRRTGANCSWMASEPSICSEVTDQRQVMRALRAATENAFSCPALACACFPCACVCALSCTSSTCSLEVIFHLVDIARYGAFCSQPTKRVQFQKNSVTSFLYSERALEKRGQSWAYIDWRLYVVCLVFTRCICWMSRLHSILFCPVSASDRVPVVLQMLYHGTLWRLAASWSILCGPVTWTNVVCWVYGALRGCRRKFVGILPYPSVCCFVL